MVPFEIKHDMACGKATEGGLRRALWGQSESASGGEVCCGRGFYGEVVHSSGGEGMTSGPA
jgi:hypothetical protein